MNLELFTDITAYAQDLEQMHAERDDLLEHMQDIYLLNWADKDKLQKQFANMHITISPAARNAIKAAIRLMTASEPGINVPKELQDEIGKEVGDQIERMSSVMLRASDRYTGQPLHLDACLSGLLYDEIHISVNPTWEMVEYAKGGSKAQLARVKAISDRTPFLFQVHNPIGCYPDFDYLGLRAWCRKVALRKGEVLDRYGAAGENAIGAMNKTSTLDEYVVWSYWDLENYACWIEGSGEPIHLEPHGLPVIPVAVHTVDGSRMFADVEDQREPFLYTLYESGLWNAQNWILSAMVTNSGMAIWPQLVYEGPEGTEPQIDLANPFGYISLTPGAKLETFRKTLIDPALPQMWALAEQLGTESTIYKQVAGGGLGSGETFSSISLLSQSGRLPLIGVQRKGGWAIGDALRRAFAILRDEGGTWKGRDGSVYAELKAKDLPESLEIEVTLDAELPQDRLQMANIFNILQGKVSQEWLMENILNIKQPGEMMRQLMTEQATQMHFQMYLQQHAQQMQMMQAQQQQAMQQSQMPPGGPPNETMSNPMMGGLPPEMMAGGMQGPRGPMGTPEEGMYESDIA